MRPIDYATRYRMRGWAPIPIPPRAKRPVLDAWQDLRLTLEELPERFGGRANIGILTGEPSANMVDVDLDHPIAVELADQFLPATGAVFGRPGKPRSHWLYRLTEPAATHKREHKPHGMIVELRSTGCQTVFPGSVHPSGEPIEWDLDNEPMEIHPAALKAAVDALADEVCRRLGVEPEAKPKRREPAGKGKPSRPAAPTVIERARKYLATIEPAVMGQAGSTPTYHAACVLVEGFALSVDEAFPLMVEYSERCVPPWSEREIRHKLQDAMKNATNRGHLLSAERSAPSSNGDCESFTAEAADDFPGIDPDGRTEVANGRRFRIMHGERVRYCDTFGRWYVWCGTHWAQDDNRAIEGLAKGVFERVWAMAKDLRGDAGAARFAAATGSARGIRAMLDLARSEKGIPVRPADLDRDGWLLNVANGTLDLRTGELREHRQADAITKLCPTTYDPAATCPTWLAFLDRIMAGNQGLISFLQRAVGYSLTGVIREHVLLFLYGKGQNGKSTFLNAMQHVLGTDFSMKAPPNLLMQKFGEVHSTEVFDLCGQRFVVAIEADEGRRLAESLVKELTGGDRLRARPVFENNIEFAPTHKVWLAANHKPTIRGTDIGIWRRVKMVPFLVEIPREEQDTDLLAKLQAEAAGILTWAVQGCRDWSEYGLAEPDEVRQATAGYRAEMDMLGKFIEDSCIVGPEHKVRAKDLYKVYADWAGDYAMNQKNFGITVAERGFQKQLNNGTWYLGLGLTDG